MINEGEKLNIFKYWDKEANEGEFVGGDPESIVDLIPYETGDQVRVFLNVTEEEDSESYYYIREFEKKRGEVIEVIMQPRLQYRVRFNQQEAILYHEELTI
ncbi:hypothetical protein [Bacillus cihuensis]|uniref:hypothetical protein n=1 Tax=Bacillus cihuensis TaxID=1208599 RepID=UPI0003F64249|nr:hypothetical protein [Bacillus cihuensis]